MDLLYIDDDLDDLELFSEAVKAIAPSCSCVMTTSGEEGLSMLATLRPHCVFLDINMPRLNGCQLLKRIRENKMYDAVKVCILSTAITGAESTSYKKMGANFCIKKPTSFGELKKSLEQCLLEVSRTSIDLSARKRKR